MKCQKNSQHVYDDSLKSCPWCERTAQLGGYDPFPSKEAVRSGTHKGAVAPPVPKTVPQRPTAAPVRPVARAVAPSPPHPVAPSSAARATKTSVSTKSQNKSTAGHWLVIGLGVVAVIYLFNANSSKTSSPGTTTSPARVSPPAIRMLPPAKRWVNIPVQGLWRGSFSGDPAKLWIKGRQNNVFWGVLFIQITSGSSQARYHTIGVAIRGTLPGNGLVTMRETQVIRQHRADKWALGTDAGTISNNGRTMNGAGKDSRRNTYKWSLSKTTG